LSAGEPFAIVRLPAKRCAQNSVSQNEAGQKEVVDEMFETLHNLASSLMNTTLPQQAVTSSTKQSSLKINSR
jgi:hypothetical protein